MINNESIISKRHFTINMAGKKRPRAYRDVSIYYRDANKVWRKIPDVKVALEYDKPITIYQTDWKNRNEQLYLVNN